MAKPKRSRNPKATSEIGSTQNGPPSRFSIYVGTLLAPKIMAPVSVYLGKGFDYEFWCLTPDREYAIGSGYFGSADLRDCVRQHMLPGLIDSDDKGTGYGTILYLAGNMVVAAAREDPEGNFPWKASTKEQCTFSRTDDRSTAADRAWKNLVKHGFAEEDEEEGEEEEIESSYDADDFISESDVEHQFEQEHGVDPDSVSIEGRVYASGTKQETIVVNFMDWETIRNSGLVLHLSEFFDDPNAHEIVPPRIFAHADWSHTPIDDVVNFAIQNGLAAEATQSEGTTSEYLMECLCHLHERGWDTVVAALEVAISGTYVADLEAIASNPRRGRRNPACPVTFSKSARSWEKHYGAAFEEPDDMSDDALEKNPSSSRVSRIGGRIRSL